MADKDTSANSDELDTSKDDVETSEDDSEEDETVDTEEQDDDEEDTESDNDEESDDSDDSDDDSETDDDDEEEDEEEESEFKKAFSTIKGETPLEYISNLEEAYRKSGVEAKRLNGQAKDLQGRIDLINQAAAKNPELAKLLNESVPDGEANPVVDPAVQKVRQDYEEKVAKDLETFMGQHPDLEDDEELQDEFMENVATLGAAARKKGKVLEPSVAYKKAWAMLDHDDSQDKVVNAAKSAASKPKTSNAKKKQPQQKSKLTSEQIAWGKKMGLSEKQMLANLEKE
jgi:hypothetical protein